ncbi:hypothetical protein [Streptomyces sp. enrichment culture]|uniref:hypothetical protein n=1 Tax=Streptomyces sp. enrichment culture TaxID=1795815 RepID=UPI003F57DDB8
MSARASHHESDPLPTGTVDVVVTGGGAAGPNGDTGRRLASATAGATEIPGVWLAGDATDLTAQPGASVAAGTLAGSRIDALLSTADTGTALAAAQQTAG